MSDFDGKGDYITMADPNDFKVNDNHKYSQEERRDHKPCPICGDWHSAMRTPTDFIILKSPLVESLNNELTAEKNASELHADLNRRTAEALGKPFAGDNSSWHDIPEQVTTLITEVKEAAEFAISALNACQNFVDNGEIIWPQKKLNKAMFRLTALLSRIDKKE